MNYPAYPLFFIALLLSFEISAVQTLNKSVSLNVTQTVGTTETSTTNTPINITTVTPNYSLQYEKRKVSLNVKYGLIASHDNENDKSDISHGLDLIARFQHIPNKWSSSYSANIFNKNKSNSGVLVGALAVSDATETYMVNKIDTARIFDISNSSRLSSSIAITTQGFRDQSTEKNALFSLQHELRQIIPSVNFNYSLNRNQNLDTDDFNNSLKLTTFYAINSKVESFITISKNSGSNNLLTDTRYTIGMNWQITPKSFLNFGFGKFGDTNSWSLDSSITSRRSTFSIKHTEEVAPANQNLINNITTNTSNLLSSVNNDFKYIKNTSLTLNHRTRRLTTSLVFSLIKEFTDLGITSDKTIKSTELNLNYSLSNIKSISYNYSRNSIETLINNQLIENSVKWSAALSRQSNYNVRLSHTKQSSDNAIINYSTNQLDFNYTLLF